MSSKFETILILDFGGQYTQLIGRRIREANVYTEIVPFNTPLEKVKAMGPKGLILGGGPASVYETDAPICDPEIFKLDVPVLKDEDAQRLSDQTATVMEIVKSNERLFGDLGFVLVRHEAVDGMFIPVDASTTVLVGLVKPYDQDKIEQAVRRKIKTSLARKNVDSI